MRASAVGFLCVLLAGCGGIVVYDDAPASSGGGGPSSTSSSASQTSAAGQSTGPVGSTGGGDGGGTVGPASASSSSSSTGAGGAPPDGSCIAADYCSCITVSTCQVIAEDCFCSCDEPCSEPCDCDCGGGAFLMCAPGSIEDPGALDVGVWLVGWSGDVNHFSWLRFDPDGRLAVLDGADLTFNSPYFPCTGSGSWSFDGSPETVRVELPPGCAPTSLTFGEWGPLWPDPAGALQAAFLFDSNLGVTLGAWRFADDTCSPDFATCTDPLAI